MTSQHSSSPTHSERNDNGTSGNSCAICGATASLSEYTLDPSSDTGSAIALCPNHYQVAAILSGARFQESDIATDYDLQETRKITVRVPKALIDTADSAAEQQGQTRSEFVRDGIQMAIEIQEMEAAFADIVSQAVQSPPDAKSEADVEFLKERIRKLESLLEQSLDKL